VYAAPCAFCSCNASLAYWNTIVTGQSLLVACSVSGNGGLVSRHLDKASRLLPLMCRYGVPPGTIVKVSCLSDSAAPASAAGDSPPAAQSEVSCPTALWFTSLLVKHRQAHL